MVGFAFVVVLLAAAVIGPMFGWRIAAKHQEFIKFTSDPVPREKIREAFVELGWTLDSDQPDSMVACTGLNWRSWGERVSLHFRSGGADVISECALPSQAIDYGRNRMNVRNLAEALKQKGA